MLARAVGQGFKMVQPGKAPALRDWPTPTEKGHVVSLRAFANFLRAFYFNFMGLPTAIFAHIDFCHRQHLRRRLRAAGVFLSDSADRRAALPE